MAVDVKFLTPPADWNCVGDIPHWLSDHNPKSAANQLDGVYQGGWQPFDGFTLLNNNSIKYPGDPELHPLAEMRLRQELILVYPCSWVAIIQPDRSFEISRMA